MQNTLLRVCPIELRGVWNIRMTGCLSIGSWIADRVSNKAKGCPMGSPSPHFIAGSQSKADRLVRYRRGRCLHRPVVPTMTYAFRNYAVGTPILGCPNLAVFDCVCGITAIFPLGFCLHGRFVNRPYRFNRTFSDYRRTCPPYKGEQKGVACRQCVSRIF